MDKVSIKAALKVMNIEKIPRTQAQLKSIYRKQVKVTHPDTARTGDDKPFLRVHKAYEVLSAVVDELNKPKVRIKFGEGEYKYAKVAKIKPEGYKDCTYVVALKWFKGMTISIDGGEWIEVHEPKSYAICNIWVYFI